MKTLDLKNNLGTKGKIYVVALVGMLKTWLFTTKNNSMNKSMILETNKNYDNLGPGYYNNNL